MINRTLGDDRDLLGSTVQKIVSDNAWVRAVVVRVSLYGRAIWTADPGLDRSKVKGRLIPYMGNRQLIFE